MTTEAQIKLRVPLRMRESIRQCAEANRRSMNSEIVHCLDRALAAENENGPVEGATSPDLNTTNPARIDQ